MKARLLGALAKLDPRLLLVLMFFAIGLVAYEGWYLALRKPFLAYQKVVAARATLGATLSGSADAQGEVSRLAAELLGLLDRLAGELRLPAADDEMVASLMTELERSARTDGVVLIGIRPGARRRVLSFEEASFEISAQGKYIPLGHWLMGFEQTLSRRATVSEFTMKSIDEGRQVALTVRLALYRALPAPGAGS